MQYPKNDFKQKQMKHEHC